MKKFETTITTKSGKEKIIKVFLDDITAKLLEEANDDELTRNYIIEEYKAKLIDRKETRRCQSLDKSMEHGFDIADEDFDLDNIAMGDIERERLHNALGKLSAEQRKLIQEVYFDGTSQSEISKREGVSRKAINNRLARIYEQLKKFLN